MSLMPVQSAYRHGYSDGYLRAVEDIKKGIIHIMNEANGENTTTKSTSEIYDQAIEEAEKFHDEVLEQWKGDPNQSDTPPQWYPKDPANTDAN